MIRLFVLTIFLFSTTACKGDGGGGGTANNSVSSANFPTCNEVGTLERQYPRQNLPENMRLVTDHYGNAVISETSTTYYSLYRGWSSWWYPHRNTELFSSSDSPLKMYDQWVSRNKGERVAAAHWHQQNIYDTRAYEWEGFCAPRAYASMVELVPKKSVRIDGQCYSPEDIKALLTMTYEKVSPKKLESDVNKKLVFGQQYLHGADDYLNDIYPDQFVRFIQHSLDKNNRPFLMDHEKNNELWMDVVHEANITITDKTSKSIDVRIVVKMALFDYNNYSEAVSSSKQTQYAQTTRSYTAKLYGCWNDKHFVVSSGEWTGNSKFDHPDFVVDVPTSNLKNIKALRGSRNPEIKTEYIDELVKKALAAEKKKDYCSK